VCPTAAQDAHSPSPCSIREVRGTGFAMTDGFLTPEPSAPRRSRCTPISSPGVAPGARARTVAGSRAEPCQACPSGSRQGSLPQSNRASIVSRCSRLRHQWTAENSCTAQHRAHRGICSWSRVLGWRAHLLCVRSSSICTSCRWRSHTWPCSASTLACDTRMS